MNHIAIVYQSKYGSTKQYVEALNNVIACDIYETKKVNVKTLENYQTIIFAGGVYAGNISGLSFYKKNKEVLADKNIAVLAVGFCELNEELINILKDTNLKDLDIPLFYGRGSLNYETMTTRDRLIIKMIKKMISKKDEAELDNSMKIIKNVVAEPMDWFDKGFLNPLIDYINSLSK